MSEQRMPQQRMSRQAGQRGPAFWPDDVDYEAASLGSFDDDATSLGFVDYDATAVESSALRGQVELTLDDFGLRRMTGICSLLSAPCRIERSTRALVVGDLSRLIRSADLDCLVGAPASMSVVFLVTTDRDRRRLQDPEIALQLSDERFSLLHAKVPDEHAERPEGRAKGPDEHAEGPDERTSARAYIAARLYVHLGAVVERMQACCVRAAQFSAVDDTLWLEFGDGLQRAVQWSELPFSADIQFQPATAYACKYGEAVVIVAADGREGEIDAGELRGLLGAPPATDTDAPDHAERVAAGARLGRIRAEMGLSQEQLQIRTGISQETLSRIENGHRDPRMATLRKLAAGLSMDLPDLLGRMGR